MRHPLTALADGAPGERGPGIAFELGFVALQINFAGRQSGVVVDD